MHLKGKIIFAGPLQGGTSKRTGATWKSQDYVIETIEQYPRRCCFNVFGEDRINSFNLRVGDLVTVHLDVDAHEYNHRWFNEIRAWKVERN